MFLKKTLEKNSALVRTAIEMHQNGGLLPDTYVVDVDAVLFNAALIKKEADRNHVHLYFMLKQLGRNPVLAAQLMNLGFDGAVAVDFREALSFIQAGIKLGNVGHLVQIPKSALKTILSAKPEYVTVYSLEKAKEINEVCGELGCSQKLMIRVTGDSDILYSGQEGGIPFSGLSMTAEELLKLKNVRLDGLTSFPCFLYNDGTKKTEATGNVSTLLRAKKLLEERGIEIEQMNMPSATCCETVPLIHRYGGTHGEPGHGLMGSTPRHAEVDCPEVPAMVYLSEVSHNWNGYAYCYGGGHYRRSHVENALVGPLEDARILDVTAPAEDSIDYYFRLGGPAKVSQSVIMAFRTQIFVTRSQVALIKGISSGQPELMGIYTSLGQRLK